MKMQYFVEHKWPKSWVTTAKEMVREEFDKYASAYTEKHNLVCFHTYSECLRCLIPEAQDPSLSTESTDVGFDFLDISMGAVKGKLDDLDRYLSHPVEKVSDATEWWYKQRETYLVLYHMALDFLTIPGEFHSISERNRVF